PGIFLADRLASAIDQDRSPYSFHGLIGIPDILGDLAEQIALIDALDKLGKRCPHAVPMMAENAERRVGYPRCRVVGMPAIVDAWLALMDEEFAPISLVIPQKKMRDFALNLAVCSLVHWPYSLQNWSQSLA